MKFNKEKIMHYKTVIHCETKEQAIELLSWADSIGLTWDSQESYVYEDRWNIYESDTCYTLPDGKYGSVRFFKMHDYNILKFEDVVIEENLISMSKKYKTRNGCDVRVICTDRKYEDLPVLALVSNLDTEMCYAFTKEGRYSIEDEHEIDLVEIEPIPDKTLVRCWDDKGSTFIRYEKFYDAINHCTFFASGKRHGGSFDNYEIIDPEPIWATEARKDLED